MSGIKRCLIYVLLMPLVLALPFAVSASDTLDAVAAADERKPPTRQKDWPGPKLLVPLTSVEHFDADKWTEEQFKEILVGARGNDWIAYLVSVAKSRCNPDTWPFEPLFVWRYVDQYAERYILLDGYHRYMAAKIAEIDMAEVIVHPNSVTTTVRPPDDLDWRSMLTREFSRPIAAEDVRPRYWSNPKKECVRNDDAH
jgi:hypothetical protein